ncbi:hypothetical protein GCM10008931_43810 [Oceanobacillus oncorhynchi subsp. oncorhynchi]|uniref:hypothetical protein n=1 Tax=Oceanobacillus oncorhynchi TaxID=545501 RepID=UPI0031CF4CFF
MGRYDKTLTDILEDMHKKTGRKHDVYYQKDKGALFVPEGYELLPEYVVASISEMQLAMMSGDVSSIFETMGNVFR